MPAERMPGLIPTKSVCSFSGILSCNDSADIGPPSNVYWPLIGESRIFRLNGLRVGSFLVDMDMPTRREAPKKPCATYTFGFDSARRVHEESALIQGHGPGPGLPCRPANRRSDALLQRPVLGRLDSS